MIKVETVEFFQSGKLTNNSVFDVVFDGLKEAHDVAVYRRPLGLQLGNDADGTVVRLSEGVHVEADRSSPNAEFMAAHHGRPSSLHHA